MGEGLDPVHQRESTLEGFWLLGQRWVTRQEGEKTSEGTQAPSEVWRRRECWKREDFGLQVYEALNTQAVKQVSLREVGRTEEVAELLLLGEGMSGEEGPAVLEIAVMWVRVGQETQVEVEMSAEVVPVLVFAAGQQILH